MNDMHDVSDEQLRGAYRQMLSRRTANRRDCASPEELLGIIEGRLSEGERLRVLRHVGTCASCHKELELLRLAADVAHHVEQPRRLSMPVLAAAASVVLVMGGVALWSRNGTDVGNIDRGAGAIELLVPAPDSAVSAPLTLIWASATDAPRYEVELLDRDGKPVYVLTTRDTAAAIPDSVRLQPGNEYRWWVRALKPDGSQPASTVRRLRIARP
jgi:hypothetical protein